MIIADNSPADCSGSLTSLGHNIDSDRTCNLAPNLNDLLNTDPMLGPLADNGGPTLTHVLQPGSPAIDAGDNDACPATDQRGVPRPIGDGCDIGAFEWGEVDPEEPEPGDEPVPPFSDVPADHPFHDEIMWLAAQGIATGYPDGTYRPSNAVARMAVAAFLYRMAGEPPFDPPDVPTFEDVDATHPFFLEIEWLASTDSRSWYVRSRRLHDRIR